MRLSSLTCNPLEMTGEYIEQSDHGISRLDNAFIAHKLVVLPLSFILVGIEAMGAAIDVDKVTYMRLFPVRFPLSCASSLSVSLIKDIVLGSKGGFRLSGRVAICYNEI
jgi:hypothetical protein